MKSHIFEGGQLPAKGSILLEDEVEKEYHPNRTVRVDLLSSVPSVLHQW